MSPHVIKIFVKGKALSYSDRAQVVRPGEQVQWSCEHDYVIQFADNRSPFVDSRELSLSRAANTPTDVKTVRERIRGNGRDPYKYSVAVHVGGASPILLDDPVIIVDDDA